MKKSNEHSLKSAIENMMDSYGIRKKYNESLLVENWEKVVGPVIAKHTTQIYVREAKLFLTVDSAALKNELHYGREKLMQLLNEQFSEPVINEIIIR